MTHLIMPPVGAGIPCSCEQGHNHPPEDTILPIIPGWYMPTWHRWGAPEAAKHPILLNTEGLWLDINPGGLVLDRVEVARMAPLVHLIPEV